LIRTLARFNIAPDLVAIEKRTRRGFERLERILQEGVMPDAATWAEIDKQVEREVTQQLRQMTKAAIRNYKQARREQESDRATWTTVGDADVCGSCEPRHGKSRTWKAWDRAGRPGSAALVCGQECRCSLLPDPLATED
jgi:hypothetical protein